METRAVEYIFADKSNSNAKGKEKKRKDTMVISKKQVTQDKDMGGERVHIQLLYKSLPE